MSRIPDSLPAELNDKLRGRVVFVGIGNLLKGDDALGPKLVEELASKGLKTVDAGTTPENYIGKVASMEPDTVVLIDAVHLDSKPGSV
ncbi:MAG: hydrogenase maturation protease, partial [Candidatus Aegiribacteria sp.]|nr:hydrogenase maturation protease [Candidatus Aegiribacteria sp.]MBD3294154.1 hydrogenase maturation protease [Candidatus Fermentibacteria bacterium]